MMFKLTTAAALVMVLSACGGGGGGGGGGVAAMPIALPVAQAPAAPPPASVDCSVTLYGDSILYGYTNAGRLSEPPASGIKRLRPAYRVEDRTEPGDYVLRRLPTFLNQTIDTRFVVIEHGMNDAGNGFDYESPLRTMVQRVKALGAVPVITGLSNVRVPLEKREAYNAIARRIADEEGAVFADWNAVAYDSADMADDVHPAQPYSTRLTEKLVAALDTKAPECRP